VGPANLTAHLFLSVSPFEINLALLSFVLVLLGGI
jgi:hypothetical protein